MKGVKKPLLSGAASEVITPFSEKGEVDYGLLENEVQFMLQKGVTGFFVNGLASEALMITSAERYEIAKVVREVTEAKAPVLGNILENSTLDGIKAAKIYEQLGLDAITITPPSIYKYTNDGLYAHFIQIAETVKIPTYLYNAPETNTKLPPSLIVKLLEGNDSIIGLKDSSQNFIELLTLLDEIKPERHFELLSGSDGLTVPIMMLGGCGVISLVTTVFPELIIKMCDAASVGEWETAIELQKVVLRVRKALKIGPFMAAYKFVGSLIGNPMGTVKKPLTDLNDSEKESILKLLKNESLL